MAAFLLHLSGWNLGDAPVALAAAFMIAVLCCLNTAVFKLDMDYTSRARVNRALATLSGRALGASSSAKTAECESLFGSTLCPVARLALRASAFLRRARAPCLRGAHAPRPSPLQASDNHKHPQQPW